MLVQSNSLFPHPLLKLRNLLAAYEGFFVNRGFEVKEEAVAKIIMDLVYTGDGNIEGSADAEINLGV